MAAALTWQVVLRDRLGQPIPPELQAWFNRFIANGHGARVRTAPPHTAINNRAAVGLLMSYGLSKSEAIRHVAAASGCSFNAVSTSLRRPAYKKK